MSGAGWVILIGLALLAFGGTFIPFLAAYDQMVTGKIRTDETISRLFDRVVAPSIICGLVITLGGALFALWQLVAP